MLDLKQPKAPILDEMEKSSYYFHLTGSRSTGFANADSDWDFFEEDKPGLTEFLEELGFRELGFGENEIPASSETEYSIDETFVVGVYRRYSFRCNVDVIIVKSEYIGCFSNIRDFLVEHPVGKDDARQIWRILLGYKRFLNKKFPKNYK